MNEKIKTALSKIFKKTKPPLVITNHQKKNQSKFYAWEVTQNDLILVEKSKIAKNTHHYNLNTQELIINNTKSTPSQQDHFIEKFNKTLQHIKQNKATLYQAQ